MNKKIALVLLFLASSGYNWGKDNQINYTWPKVMPVKDTVLFLRGNKTYEKIVIFSRINKPMYLLECHLGPYDDPHFIYSGEFECRLTSLYSSNKVSSLLTEDHYQSRDWASRGRFLFEELQGNCCNYPEYGAIRHFKLRGMILTIKVQDLEIDSTSAIVKENGRPSFAKLKLIVDIENDSTAISEISERPRYQEPPYMNPKSKTDFTRDCNTIISK